MVASLGAAALGRSPGPPSSCTSYPSGAFVTSDELLAAGASHLERGEPSRAVALLSAALTRRPEHIETALKLSEAREQLGQSAEALRLLESVFARQPGDVPLRIRLARLRAKAGDVENAIELLVRDRDDPRVVRALSDLYRLSGRFMQAWETAKAGLELAPGDFDLWLAYVDAALASDRAGLALEHVQEAADRLGWRPALHLRAARAREQLGDILGKTVIREDREGRAGQFCGDWLLLEARFGGGFLCCPAESAMYQVRRALDGGCDLPEAHLLHAKLWMRAGRPAVAHAILTAHEASLLDGRIDADVLGVMAEVAYAAGDMDAFLRFKRREAHGRAEHAAVVMGAAYVQAAEHYGCCGDSVLHAEMLRRALATTPADIGLRVRVGDAEWELGRTAQAVGHYRAVLAQAADHPQRLRMLERIGSALP